MGDDESEGFSEPLNWKEEDASIERLTNYLNSVGLKDLASEIHNLKFVNRSMEASAAANYWALSLELWKIKEDKLVDDELAVQSALFDKSSSYNNVVLTLGYAGFFSIWSIVNESLNPVQNAWVGVLLGSSLFVFVVWTLLNSVFLTFTVRGRAKLFEQEFESRQEQIEVFSQGHADTARASNFSMKLWPFVFIFTAGTGMAAGGFLTIILFTQLVGMSLSNLFSTVWNSIAG